MQQEEVTAMDIAEPVSNISESVTQVDKSEKYDRQIRLWGAEGQQSIENASIAVLHATSTTTETLKNLILPGVGSFTIVDNGNVTEEDLGSNFFVSKEHLGAKKATTCCDLLKELNPDVTGHFLCEEPSTIIEENISWFDRFTVVIATEIEESVLVKLSAYLYDKGIPLVNVRSFGLIGYIRLQVKEHQVIESKPDDYVHDLRLHEPWNELLEYLSSIDVDELDAQAHGHLPFLVVLYHCVQAWKLAHNGTLPSSYKEKDEFKQFVLSKRLSDTEANFQEAFSEAKYVWMPAVIPDTVKHLFEIACDLDVTLLNPFWVCVKALDQFASENDNKLPLRGSLPDMECDTASYQTLQSLYKAKATHDVEAFTKIVRDIVATYSLNKNSIDVDELVASGYINLFCKNAHFLSVVRTRSIAQEISEPDITGLAISNAIDDDMYGTPYWYLLLRGVDRFYSTHKRVVGDRDDEVESDIPRLKKCIQHICTEMNVPLSRVSDDAIHEMCRFGGAELHSVAASIGGVASQEVIKLITHQLIPLGNTFILNGISCTGASFAV